ncbi:MAG: transcription factor E [Candidatus Methanomethylicota archaeon]|uniref:Transcription factor E n=1 Tax=Thermoproteota archaeon TaxID=2056631 RepID=A0A497EYZ3_9CREN|nr:MAG: transcription factor E [Candidatus Verstraetearchaeota archaeon]
MLSSRFAQALKVRRLSDLFKVKELKLLLKQFKVSSRWSGLTRMYDYYEMLGFEIDESFIAVIEEIGGEDAVAVALALADTYEMTDEQIAEKTGIKLNSVRKILYTLFDNQLVSYRRIRDKSTGWYVYLWHLNRDNIESLVNLKKQLVLEKLSQRLEYERNHMFFYCPRDGIRMTFEDAVETEFKCPICESPLQPHDNKQIIAFLEKKVKALREELAKARAQQ